MAKKIIITIDGWSSCGKSTLAKQIAKELGYVYVDSGAMYRAITLFFLRNNIDLTSKKEIKEALQNISLEFIFNAISGNSEIYLNSENVEYLIRDMFIAEKFGERGDLNLASKGLFKEDFKIVMSHDPSHWDEKIQHDDNHYHLTLSGHTHGFQFGIEIPGWIKWSPVQYVYKQWAGLYENAGRYIYVNRGFGFHAYPGRVGIMPEITVIELKKGEKVA